MRSNKPGEIEDIGIRRRGKNAPPYNYQREPTQSRVAALTTAIITNAVTTQETQILPKKWPALDVVIQYSFGSIFIS